MFTLLMNLDIPQDRLLRYYRGAAQSVYALAEDGRRVRFPARFLRRFVTAYGVRGRFALTVGADNKLLDMRQIG